jgi:hypothetical protein
METDVVCPDCGKVIAPAGAVDDMRRCRCAEQRAPLSPSEVPTRPSISIPIPQPPPPPPPPPPPSRSAPTEDLDSLDDASGNGAMKPAVVKACYVCGTSLAGRTRLKDHLGRYWCKECAAADERAKRREAELRCPDCSRVFPQHKLVYFQTERVCPSCFKAREKALEKKIVKSNINKLEKQHEWKQLKWMALIAGGLIVIATLFQLLR